MRAPNQDGHRGDNDDHDAAADSGSRRASTTARRRLEAAPATGDGGVANYEAPAPAAAGDESKFPK